MNSFKLRIIFIIIAIVYIIAVPAVFASEQDFERGISEGMASSEEIDLSPAGHSSEENLSSNDQMGENGVENIKMEILLFEGKEMFQLRDMAEKFDWSLHYNTKKKEIIIRSSDKLYTLKTDSKSSSENKDNLYPLIREGRTYLSTSLLSDILKEMGEERIISGLYIDKSVYDKGENIWAKIRFFNLTEESLKLNFGSGQRYDLYLLQDGQELWRWSDGRFFTMALVQKELQPGESLKYDIEVEIELEAGDYILSGEMATIPERIGLDEVKLTVVEE